MRLIDPRRVQHNPSESPAMMQLDSTPLCLSETGAVTPRAARRAYLALMAAAGGLITALLLATSVAANSGGEAERIAAMPDDGYVATLVAALAVDLAKPLR
ncbi:hypothetical protein MKK69_07235 [Methylobacterium sp. J-026]|uniref:hypothetical protein n=1 Tax=Methylobacterium sp. J-026 TaxID=2836624 RepID=UPI001FB8A8B7|nr:hypothetical protein [Methylobacterium sp. J-026]MCJ2133863.1 hypothetical protein [Methylobacterium sp. J-026]